jgi:hypothetical protein
MHDWWDVQDKLRGAAFVQLPMHTKPYIVHAHNRFLMVAATKHCINIDGLCEVAIRRARMPNT